MRAVNHSAPKRARRERLRPALGGAAVVALATMAAGLHQPAEAAPAHVAKGGARLVKVGDFTAPDFVAGAPGVRDTVYVVQRGGKVIAIRGGKRSTFLDMSGRTTTEGERGLLSIAFDPNFKRNHRFYTYSTNPQHDIEIDRWRARSGKRASAGSRHKVLVIPHIESQEYHYGGTIRFGPDGLLYAAIADGAVSTNSQDKHTLLGKLLRIDPHPRHGKAYTVPRSNPFVGKPGRNEIYALGFRNPFRWSFDGRKIVIADVGYNHWEEVDYESPRRLRGANFGWDYYEGFHRTGFSGPKPRHKYRPPIFNYPHTNGRCAIIGGTVVRDRALKSLRGRFVYADLCTGKLRSLVPHRKRATGDHSLGLTVPDPAGIVAANGHVYVASLDGQVYRLAPNH
jgi:glucose/arabinose dehydrogenase